VKLTDYPPAATLLEPEDLEKLIPDLLTRAELNAAEQANILRALLWARTNRALRTELLSIGGFQRLHREMFRAVWRWAGEIRSRELNIGVEAYRIREEIPKLCGDVGYWIEHGTYPWPELAVRFHHRLVWIHPFLNGNGRHARLASDLLLEYQGEPPLSWGGDVGLVEASPGRAEYIAALRDADRGSYERLLEFATSR
jgi:Fic-DOC domain mobile mystery protein B